MFHFQPTTKREVVAAIKSLEDIVIPEGDHEGEPLNSPSVYNLLTRDVQCRVDQVLHEVSTYVRVSHEEPNRRSLTELRKEGIQAQLHQSQYDANRLVGYVRFGNVELDISDPVHGDQVD